MKRIEYPEEIKLFPFVEPGGILPTFPEYPECSISVILGRSISMCNIPVEMTEDDKDKFAVCLKEALRIVGVEL